MSTKTRWSLSQSVTKGYFLSTRGNISAYDVAAAVFLFFLFFFAMPVLYRFAYEFAGKKLIVGKVAAPEDHQVLDFLFIDGKPYLYSVILVVILGPIVEEFLDRGIIFSFLRNHMPFFAAALIGSVLFAVSHVRLFSTELPMAFAGLSPRILSGFAACYLLEKSGSLWPPILFHMLKNGAAVALVTHSP